MDKACKKTARLPLDWEQALQQMNGKERLVVDLLDGFLHSCDDYLAEILRAFSIGELQRAAEIAHAVKGTAGLLYAFPLAEAARRFEACSTSSDFAQASAALEQMACEVERLHAFCRDLQTH